MCSLKKLSDLFSTVMNDSARKPLHSMLAEIINLWVRDSVFPRHYYSSLLYKKDLYDNIYAHVGWQNMHKVRLQINDPLWAPILDNKVLFDLFFRQTDIRLPVLVGINSKSRFVIGDDVIWVFDGYQLLDVLESLVNSSSTASIFAKPIDGCCGRGCFMFDLSSVSRICADRGLEVLNSNYVYQEVIVQHPKMAKLHPSSVNTLRIDTYRTDQGQVNVMSALNRMGASKSLIDNASAGGCFVGVDLEQGTLTLMRKGFMSSEQKHATLERHPDTGVVFDGFAIPFFHEAIITAKRAAEMVPISLVGWDVAISQNGPVLIEGDPCHGVRTLEMAYGGYYRNPVFRRLIEDHAPQLSRMARKLDKTYPGEIGQVTDV